MKRFLVILVSLLVALAIGLGVFFVVDSCQNKKDDGENKHNVAFEQEFLEETYAQGDLIMLRGIATADVEFTGMTYTINNASEVSMTVKSGESADVEDELPGNGKFYVDSGIEMIDTTDMEVGYYVLAFYAQDEDGTRYKLGEPQIFEIVASTNN